MTLNAPLTLRLATPADTDAVMELVREFEEYEGYARDEASVLYALSEMLSRSELGRVAVVARDGTLLGYSIVSWGWGLESGGREALLDEIYVSHRGEGIGAKLFDYSRQLAAEAGTKVLFLETERANERARAFYLRHGMEVEDSIWLSVRL